uniref:Uncharacterized protein n=1 Tax=Oryza nivara TaxID=4536 RepID=A0A0E0J512_ORYNI
MAVSYASWVYISIYGLSQREESQAKGVDSLSFLLARPRRRRQAQGAGGGWHRAAGGVAEEEAPGVGGGRHGRPRRRRRVGNDEMGGGGGADPDDNNEWANLEAAGLVLPGSGSNGPRPTRIRQRRASSRPNPAAASLVPPGSRGGGPRPAQIQQQRASSRPDPVAAGLVPPKSSSSEPRPARIWSQERPTGAGAGGDGSGGGRHLGRRHRRLWLVGLRCKDGDVVGFSHAGALAACKDGDFPPIACENLSRPYAKNSFVVVII